MNHHVESTKEYVSKYKNELIIGVLVAAALVIAVVAGVFAVRNSYPKIVYQPSAACEILTLPKAKELLGDRTIQSGGKAPAVEGGVGISNCGYTDGNPDTQNLTVAAITVRSAVNDDGAVENQREFSNNAQDEGVREVSDVGDRAYFDPRNGQMSVLEGRNWMILSIGLGDTPELNDIEKTKQLATIILK